MNQQPVRILIEMDYEVPFFIQDCLDQYDTLNPREIVEQDIEGSGWGALLEGRKLRLVSVEYTG